MPRSRHEKFASVSLFQNHRALLACGGGVCLPISANIRGDFLTRRFHRFHGFQRLRKTFIDTGAGSCYTPANIARKRQQLVQIRAKRAISDSLIA